MQITLPIINGEAEVLAGGNPGKIFLVELRRDS
jgi:hypothetical protein